jgi:hypothetical protein
MLKGLTLSLWVLAMVCFVASWTRGDGRLVTAGTTCLVLYIISAARLRRSAPPAPHA